MARPIAAVPDEVFLQQGGTEPLYDTQIPTKAQDKITHLLEELDKAGLLDVLLAAVEQRDSLLGILVNQVDKPGSIQTVKTLVGLAQVMSDMNPAGITAVGKGIATGVNRLQQGTGVEVGGIWDVLKAARDPDISRAFSAILTILKSMGEHLKPGSE